MPFPNLLLKTHKLGHGIEPLASILLLVFVSLPPHHVAHHLVQVKTAQQQAKARQQKRQHRNVSFFRCAFPIRPACSMAETGGCHVLAVSAAAWNGVCSFHHRSLTLYHHPASYHTLPLIWFSVWFLSLELLKILINRKSVFHFSVFHLESSTPLFHFSFVWIHN